MAQTFQPYGLSLYNDNGSNYSGTLQNFPLISGTTTSFYSGDPVAYNSGTDFFTTPAIPATNNLANTPQIYGIFQGVTYTNAQAQKIRQGFWTGGTTTFPYSAPNVVGTSYTPGELILQPVSNRIIYKVQASYGTGGTGTALSYNSIQTAIQGLLNNTYDIAFDCTNRVANNSTAYINVAAQGYMVTVIGVATTPQSNAGQQWLDPFPDLLVVFNKTLFS